MNGLLRWLFIQYLSSWLIILMIIQTKFYYNAYSHFESDCKHTSIQQAPILIVYVSFLNVS